LMRSNLPKYKMIMGERPMTPINNKFRLPSPKAKAGETVKAIKIRMIKLGFVCFININYPFMAVLIDCNKNYLAKRFRCIQLKIL
jgi:hypothetical protein